MVDWHEESLYSVDLLCMLYLVIFCYYFAASSLARHLYGNLNSVRNNGSLPGKGWQIRHAAGVREEWEAKSWQQNVDKVN